MKQNSKTPVEGVSTMKKVMSGICLCGHPRTQHNDHGDHDNHHFTSRCYAAGCMCGSFEDRGPA